MQPGDPNQFKIHQQCIDSSIKFQNQASQRAAEYSNSLNPVEFEKKRIRNMALASALIFGASAGACLGLVGVFNLLNK